MAGPLFMNKPKAYVVRGLGEREPAAVRLASPQELDEAVGICDEEIALIEKAIKAARIPVPPAPVAATVPEHKIEVTCAAGEEATSAPGGQETGPLKNGKSAPFLAPLISPMSRGRFADAADGVENIAAGQEVVIVGDEAWVLASALRASGLKADWLRRGGSILPRRWRRASFADWLEAHGDDLSNVGAVVLMGDHAYEAECAALRDAKSMPPIVRVGSDETGASKVGEVIASRENVDADAPWPKISVVTVSFNQAQYLEASIRSVLDQNYPNLEYIIVDGGSTDGSVEIIERYRYRCDTVIIEPDRGQSDALNKGFACATGEIMNWLCSDDLLEPGSLAVSVAYSRATMSTSSPAAAHVSARHGGGALSSPHRLPLGRTVRLDRSTSCTSCAHGRRAITSSSRRCSFRAACGKHPVPISSNIWSTPWITICGCAWRSRVRRRGTFRLSSAQAASTRRRRHKPTANISTRCANSWRSIEGCSRR